MFRQFLRLQTGVFSAALVIVTSKASARFAISSRRTGYSCSPLRRAGTRYAVFLTFLFRQILFHIRMLARSFGTISATNPWTPEMAHPVRQT